jgi:hypothetical protein
LLPAGSRLAAPTVLRMRTRIRTIPDGFCRSLTGCDFRNGELFWIAVGRLRIVFRLLTRPVFVLAEPTVLRMRARINSVPRSRADRRWRRWKQGSIRNETVQEDGRLCGWLFFLFSHRTDQKQFRTLLQLLKCEIFGIFRRLKDSGRILYSFRKIIDWGWNQVTRRGFDCRISAGRRELDEHLAAKRSCGDQRIRLAVGPNHPAQNPPLVIRRIGRPARGLRHQQGQQQQAPSTDRLHGLEQRKQF